jgi:hypothetical protein
MTMSFVLVMTSQLVRLSTNPIVFTETTVDETSKIAFSIRCDSIPVLISIIAEGIGGNVINGEVFDNL